MRHSILSLVLTLTVLLCVPPLAHARIAQWKILPNDSTLSFINMQTGLPLTGTFTSFTGDMYFDPDRLAESNVRIIVNLSPSGRPDTTLAETLKSGDGFITTLLPQAVFQSTHFMVTGFQTYQADGLLTLRDKTIPLTVSMLIDRVSPTRARLEGSTVVKSPGSHQDIVVRLSVNATRERSSDRTINPNEVWLK